MKFIKDYIINFFNGFCMALADSVPGVSGGTVAFLLGFYDKFIKSIDDLLRGDMAKRLAALKFLIKIGIGWVVGFVISATILASLFTRKIYAMSSLFIGFIIFAIPLVIKEEKASLTKNYKNIIFAVIGAFVVIAVTIFSKGLGFAVNLEHLNPLVAVYLFLAGMIAISAMVLPGISGSTMLLVFGLYIPIMTRIKAFIHLDFSVFPVLFIFGLGILFGIAFFARLLRKLLEHHRGVIDYFIIGMMIASLYSIVIGPTTLDEPLAMLTFANFDFLFFFVGGLIIIGLEFIKKIINRAS